MDTSAAQAKAEVGVGIGLMTTPFWVNLLQSVSLVASTIMAICGAILALHAVYRLVKRTRKASP